MRELKQTKEREQRGNPLKGCKRETEEKRQEERAGDTKPPALRRTVKASTRLKGWYKRREGRETGEGEGDYTKFIRSTIQSIRKLVERETAKNHPFHLMRLKNIIASLEKKNRSSL